MSRCHTCGERIWWASTSKHGKPMPLNIEPDDNGNVLIIDGKAEVVAPGEQSLLTDERWTPHFATCQNWGKP